MFSRRYSGRQVEEAHLGSAGGVLPLIELPPLPVERGEGLVIDKLEEFPRGLPSRKGALDPLRPGIPKSGLWVGRELISWWRGKSVGGVLRGF